MIPPRSVVGWVTWLVGSLVSAFVAMVIFTLLFTVIWPGQVTVTRHLYCDDDRPDAIVVSDTYSSGDGTSTNFTLYCVGPRGEAEDIGWFRPVAALTVAYTVAFWLLVQTVLTSYGIRGRRRRRRTDAEGSAGPVITNAP